MANPKSRPYSGQKDLQSMLDLLLTVRPPDRLADFPSPGDLREILALSQVRDNTRLWFDAGDRAVGFALVDLYHNLRFEIDRQGAYPGIDSEMVAWGVACVRQSVQARGEPLTLDASCRGDDVERRRLLERHGFVLQDVRTLHLVRPLHAPIPRPRVPAGFAIRHVAGEQEVGDLVALHRAAFGTEHMTVEERRAMMRVPEYEPELDLVAVAPDGRLAAYCLCSISREENERTGRNEGYTDPVATHPDFRRRGLARALLLAGLQVLKQRGMDMAVLGTSSENVAMLHTAQAAGFQVRSTTLWFSKPVAQG